MTITVNKYGLRFCRGFTVLLLLISIIFQIRELVTLTFFIMLLPAIMSFKYSPAYLLYTLTFGKFLPEKTEEVDTAEIRFAQGFGAFLLFISLFFLYFRPNAFAGWIYVGSVAMATGFGTAGLCIGALIFRFFKKLFKTIISIIDNSGRK